MGLYWIQKRGSSANLRLRFIGCQWSQIHKTWPSLLILLYPSFILGGLGLVLYGWSHFTIYTGSSLLCPSSCYSPSPQNDTAQYTISWQSTSCKSCKASWASHMDGSPHPKPCCSICPCVDIYVWSTLIPKLVPLISISWKVPPSTPSSFDSPLMPDVHWEVVSLKGVAPTFDPLDTPPFSQSTS